MTDTENMNFDEYQDRAVALAILRGGQYDIPTIVYRTLGLSGETGEVAEKVKKLIRDAGSKITPEFIESIKKELGDVLWYLAALGEVLGLSLQDIANTNIAKLEDRKARGVRQGSGDNR